MTEMETPTETEGMEEPQGLDSVISRLNSYIEDIKQATPETLSELRDDLMDLKEFMDEGETEVSEEPKDDNGLMITIGKHRNGGMK